MRYTEIIEASEAAGRAAEVWKQTEKSHEALRKLRTKQTDVADAKATANALPAGPRRTQRLQAADRRDADARRIYGDALSAANDARRRAMARAPK